jgi:hypothetical protein
VTQGIGVNKGTAWLVLRAHRERVVPKASEVLPEMWVLKVRPCTVPQALLVMQARQVNRDPLERKAQKVTRRPASLGSLVLLESQELKVCRELLAIKALSAR